MLSPIEKIEAMEKNFRVKVLAYQLVVGFLVLVCISLGVSRLSAYFEVRRLEQLVATYQDQIQIQTMVRVTDPNGFQKAGKILVWGAKPWTESGNDAWYAANENPLVVDLQVGTSRVVPASPGEHIDFYTYEESGKSYIAYDVCSNRTTECTAINAKLSELPPQ